MIRIVIRILIRIVIRCVIIHDDIIIVLTCHGSSYGAHDSTQIMVVITFCIQWLIFSSYTSTVDERTPSPVGSLSIVLGGVQASWVTFQILKVSLSITVAVAIMNHTNHCHCRCIETWSVTSVVTRRVVSSSMRLLLLLLLWLLRVLRHQLRQWRRCSAAFIGTTCGDGWCIFERKPYR